MIAVKHDYLFSLTSRTIENGLYEIGYHYAENTLSKNGVAGNSLLLFFSNGGLIDPDTLMLTEKGKELYKMKYVTCQQLEFDSCIKQLLVNEPVVILICQVFYGRGRNTIEQLVNLFALYDVCSYQVRSSEVVSLLILLNHYKIVIYDKRNKAFTVSLNILSHKPAQQYYIVPSTPFSNKLNFLTILRNSKGNVYWIDKHFRKEGLEFLFDGLPSKGVLSVTIISGKENVTQSAKSFFNDFKTELSEKGIQCEWRVINDESFMFHDRWLLSDDLCYNIPPLRAIIKGQRSEIIRTESLPDIQAFLDASSCI